jgi:hypothetical protein
MAHHRINYDDDDDDDDDDDTQTYLQLERVPPFSCFRFCLSKAYI